VFPVPDGDTGTNLALTVRAIADHLRPNTDRAVSAVAHEAALGAVLGARGNCGMMLSHFLLGFAENIASRVRISTAEFSMAMSAGVERLYTSLEDPVEGTILTVMRDSAAAARGLGTQDFVPLVTHVVEHARGSLARTPEQLAVLKRAGVVDAGAKGFVSMLEGVLLFVQGISISLEAVETNGGPDSGVALVDYPTDEEQYRFCTEALVRGDSLPSQDDVRAVLREMGDSLIVVRSDEVLKVHVHTDSPEGVFEYLRTVGSLITHKAEDMKVQRETIGKGRGGHIQLARRPIAVVTDSACDLSEEIVRAHGIHVLPNTLVDGDNNYRDGVDITAAQFHERMASASSLPTTSQPPPGAFLEAFSSAAEEGEAVVGVFLSSTLSGAYSAAEAAAARCEDVPITMTDSRGASLLQGLLVLKAAELGELGHTPREIVDEVDRVRAQSGILFTVRTFDRLRASGRVSMGKAMLGRFLGLKPVLGLEPDGKVAAYGKAFGDRRAMPELLRVLRSQIPATAEKVRFGVVHVGVPEMVQPVSEELRRTYGPNTEILAAPATPVISTHLGIGAWGVAYMVED
jgi:DegV family protein with EDD domain